MSSLSIEMHVKPVAVSVLVWVWRTSIVVLILLLLGLAWLVAYANLFKSGSELGYNLGLVGGLMMLSLLLYPLRKRVKLLGRLGKMESWFRYHMFLGISGPVLILFHSTFKIGSMNGRIALYSMLLVAISGVVGRFVYRHIHRGLYGKALTLAEAEELLNRSQESIGSVFLLRPDIEKKLKKFHQSASARIDNYPRRVWRFISLHHQGKSLSKLIRQDVKKALAAEAKRQNWSRGQLRLNYTVARRQIDNYIFAIVQTAQFSSWEKLFSLWHVAHIPFIYLLLISGIAHVIAVHLY